MYLFYITMLMAAQASAVLTQPERLGRYMFKATLSIRSRAQLHTLDQMQSDLSADEDVAQSRC